MKLAIGIVCVLALAAPARADFVIDGSAGDVTHDCGDDPVVVVNASATTFTLTGACTEVAVNGSSVTGTIESTTKLGVTGAQNTVAVEAVDKIGITGAHNKVTYKRAVKAKRTKVAKTGLGNSVKKVK